MLCPNIVKGNVYIGRGVILLNGRVPNAESMGILVRIVFNTAVRSKIPYVRIVYLIPDDQLSTESLYKEAKRLASLVVASIPACVATL